MDAGTLGIIFQVVVLLFSVIVHEISHGYVAEWLGDPTARLAGRLTLNPIPHLSFFGMVLMPLLTYFAWHMPVGAAKPVPYNPYNLKDPRRGGALIALAGPVSNLLLAAIFGAIIRIGEATGTIAPFVLFLFSQIVLINVVLAIFNLVPLPPIDGSKVVHLFLTRQASLYWDNFLNKAVLWMRSNQILFLVALFLAGPYILGGIFSFMQPIINFLFAIFTGQ
jgi:Zn-dependent protease